MSSLWMRSESGVRPSLPPCPSAPLVDRPWMGLTERSMYISLSTAPSGPLCWWAGRNVSYTLGAVGPEVGGASFSSGRMLHFTELCVVRQGAVLLPGCCRGLIPHAPQDEEYEDSPVAGVPPSPLHTPMDPETRPGPFLRAWERALWMPDPRGGPRG